MPRGVLKPEVKRARMLARLAELANEGNALLADDDAVVPVPTMSPEQLERELIKYAPADTKDDAAIAVEAVLLYYHTKGADFVKSTCPTCGRVFAYKYHIPTKSFNCSNDCRKEALAKIGIEWNPYKRPEERWLNYQKGVIPLIVPPSALELLEQKVQETSPDDTTPDVT